MAVKCVGAIDNGTQSSRFILFDTSAKAMASAQIEYDQIYPQAGWCDHDPLAILGSVQDAMDRAIATARDSVGEIEVVSVGITNQRETAVAWSATTGLPLCNAIVWHDSRTTALCDAFAEAHGGKDAFRDVVGLPVSTYFSAFKLKWMMENVPEVRAAADDGTLKVGTVDSWLIYNLTGGASGGGVHVTDVSNASRTFLMDLESCSWHPPLLQAFGIPLAALPEIRSNAEEYGRLAGGVLKGTPITGCLGDQQAALLGQRCRPGEAKNTYGTGCFMLLNTGEQAIPSTHGLLTTLGYKLGPSTPANYALEGAIAVAGAGVSWLKDQLGVFSDVNECEELAGSVPDTGGVYFVPGFGGLLAPHWRDDARGAILGLTMYSTKAHVVRAMLEAMAFQTREVLDAMRQDAAGMDMRCRLRVDGGATKNDLLMQIQADILGDVPVERPDFQESTALGAALAAGYAAGVWSHDDLFSPKASEVTTFTAQLSSEAVDKKFASWKKAVSRSLDLADLE